MLHLFQTRVGRYGAGMYEFAIDADRIVSFDGRVVELFSRGGVMGSNKWRIHRAHVGAEVEASRKGDSYKVTIGETVHGRVAADIRFEISAARLPELQAFLATFTA